MQSVMQDRFGYFVRVEADGRMENLSAPGEAPVLPLCPVRQDDVLAQRMARFLIARR